MNESLFKLLNLKEQEIQILNTLLETGKLKVAQIAEKTQITRTYIYPLLENLKSLNLIEEIQYDQKTYFLPTHPSNWQSLLDAKINELTQAKQNYQDNLPKLSSQYNLNIHKPGIKFYEGLEAVEKITEDYLESSTEILSIVNPDPKEAHYPKIAKKFGIKRTSRKINKKILSSDTNFARNRYKTGNSKYTQIKYFTGQLTQFNTIVFIYDNKVAFISVEDHVVGIIIEDKNIYKFHKSMFEINWSKAVN